MMRKVILTTVVAMSLSGCLNPNQTLQERQVNYVGHSAETLIARLGVPDAEGVVAGRKFYAWSTRETGSYTMPQYNTGTVNTTLYGGGGTAFGTGTYGYTTYNTTHYDYHCVLRAFINPQGNVTGFDMDGNLGGCGPLVSRL
ncbi:MAG: hypothetical protein R3D59_04130 [Paracoccaceae bacterium]